MQPGFGSPPPSNLAQSLSQGAHQASTLSNAPIVPPTVHDCYSTRETDDPLTGCRVNRVPKPAGRVEQGYHLDKTVKSLPLRLRSKAITLGEVEFGTDGEKFKDYLADPRFDALATDPAHLGWFGGPGLFEATAGLSAERQGLMPPPIERATKEQIEFYDQKGMPYDVKTPRSPLKPTENWDFDLGKVARSVVDQARKTFEQKGTINKVPIKVLLNVTHTTLEDLVNLRPAIMREALIRHRAPQQAGTILDADLRKELESLVNTNALFDTKKEQLKARALLESPKSSNAELRELLDVLVPANMRLHPQDLSTMTPQDHKALCEVLGLIVEVNA